jgi:hypothetical protein
MKFLIPTYLFTDWNRNSKQDREGGLSILSIMRQECIRKPTEEQWELTALEFGIRDNSPHCLGAVVLKHIREIKPEHSGSIFSCYEIFFSGINDSGIFVYVRFGSVRKRL